MRAAITPFLVIAIAHASLFASVDSDDSSTASHIDQHVGESSSQSVSVSTAKAVEDESSIKSPTTVDSSFQSDKEEAPVEPSVLDSLTENPSSPLSIAKLSPIQPTGLEDTETEATSEVKESPPPPMPPRPTPQGEASPFFPRSGWKDDSYSFQGAQSQLSSAGPVQDESGLKEEEQSIESEDDETAPIRSFTIKADPEITGIHDESTNPSAIYAYKAQARHLNEQAYLDASRNRRGTRVWNFRYLDEAAVFKDTPSFYSFGWFWQRWVRRFMHLFQPRHDLLDEALSLEAALRTSKILPLPILREAAKFISFITPDGHIANHKNIKLHMHGENCVLPKVKVVVHLYSNATAQGAARSEAFQFFRTTLDKKVPMTPQNPFQNVKWTVPSPGQASPDKWMRLVVKAARQLYAMLVLDSLMYSEYQHDLYKHLWESIADDGKTEIPLLRDCSCSMLYITPFESLQENLSFVMDDSVPVTFEDNANVLPSEHGPKRSAQVAALSKEYYSITIQLIDIMARIQGNIDANFMKHIEDRSAPAVAYLRSGIGRLVPGLGETFSKKIHADGEEFQRERDAFIRATGVTMDRRAMLPPRHRNGFPMMHFVFDDQALAAVAADVEGEGPCQRTFGPMRFCGRSLFQHRVIRAKGDQYAVNSENSYKFQEKVTTASAIKLAAPLGPSQSFIHLDIFCPCVPCGKSTPPPQDAILGQSAKAASPMDATIDSDVQWAHSVGQSAGTNEHAVFSTNCYAIWDPVTAGNGRAASSAAGKNKFWALSMNDRTMILPAIEKQVKLDGWRWAGENRTSADTDADRAYEIIVDLFHAISAEREEDCKENERNNSLIPDSTHAQETIPFAVDSPFGSSHKREAFVNATRHGKRVLNLGQVLPCVSQCASRLSRAGEKHFVAEGPMCRVGLFTELQKRFHAGASAAKPDRVLHTAFYPVEDGPETNRPGAAAFALHDAHDKNKAPFEDPLDAIKLLDGETLEPLDMPAEFSEILGEQLAHVFGELSGDESKMSTAESSSYRAKLLEWLRSLRELNKATLPGYIKKILPSAEVIPDPNSPFKRNVMCVAPSLDFHWNLQGSESVVQRDTVYAKSMAQFYKSLQGSKAPHKDSKAAAIHRHFRSEAFRNHFLFSHHYPWNVFAEKQRNQSSTRRTRDWALPIVPKDPFAQSVLPFPDTISGKHDLSGDFHPFRFPRGAQAAAYDFFLREDTGVETAAPPTLMESVTSTMLLLSFLKHISTVSLGAYLHNFLHPDMPCSSIVFSDSRDAHASHAREASGFEQPSFLGALPTKSDVFVTLDGKAPASMLVPPHARDPVQITESIQNSYASLFKRQMDFLYEKWNAIVHDWEETERSDSVEPAGAFSPPEFLSFPWQSAAQDHSASAKIMPLLQEVARPRRPHSAHADPQGMVLVNVYCPCEPIRNAAWTVMSPSCVRIYRSADSTCVYAQDPATKEFFVIDAEDGSSVEVPQGSHPVGDRYFGYMPQAFSAKFAFNGRNQTSGAEAGQYSFHDRKVMSVSADEVREHTPLSCASACQPLHVGGPSMRRDRWYSALFTHNYCQAGVAVKMKA